MLTYRLWRRLSQPPESSPLYHRIMITRPENIPCLLWLVAIILAPLLMMSFLVLTTTIYGAIWAVGITDAIMRERQSGLYDLVSTTPDGEIGTLYAICTGCVYRNYAFNRLHTLSTWVMRLIFAGVVVSYFASRTSQETLALEIGVYVAVGIVLFFDHFQTIVMSVLVAAQLPDMVTDRVTAQLLAAGVFLLLQMVTYGLAALAAAYPLPALIPPESIVSGFALMAAQVAVFVLIREGAVLLLWEMLKSRFDISPLELLDWQQHRLL